MKRRLYESVVPKARLTLRPSIAVVLSNGAPHPAAVKKYTPPAKGSAEMFGTDLALLRIAATDLPVLPLGNAQKVLAGDPVRILGFPGVVLNHELLKETAVVEASVTTGAISGFKKDVADNPVIQTDAPAAWGNSGGPAMNARGDVIGVLTFVSVTPGPEGGLVQGFNFIIPAATVRRFIEGTEVTLSGRSRFNEAWWGGLGHYFRRDFPRAVKSFEAANQLHPGVPDVQRLLDEGKGRPAPFPWVWLAAGIAIAGAQKP